MSLDALKHELAVVFEHILATRYMHVASSALLFWDYTLTFDQEVEFFWRGPWSWPRALFFVNRYWPMVEQTMNTAALTAPDISDTFCSAYLLGIFPAFVFAEILVVQAIVCFRIHCMYEFNKRVLYPLIALLVSCMAAAIGILAYTSKHSVASAHGIPGLVICGELSNVHIVYGAVVGLVVFDGIACALVLWKAYVHLFQTRTRMPFMSRLVAVIARDSLIYFACGLFVYMGNAMIWKYGAPELGGLAIGLGVALLSVLGNRMLLNLRIADAQGFAASDAAAGGGLAEQSIGGIEFASRRRGGAASQGRSIADMEFAARSRMTDGVVDIDETRDYGDGDARERYSYGA